MTVCTLKWYKIRFIPGVVIVDVVAGIVLVVITVDVDIVWVVVIMWGVIFVVGTVEFSIVKVVIVVVATFKKIRS